MSSSVNITPDEFLAYIEEVGLELNGNTPFATFNGIKDLAAAGEYDVSFCRFEGPDGQSMVSDSSAGLIFVPKSFGSWARQSDRSLVLCQHPRFEMLRFIQRFWVEETWSVDQKLNPCIHPDAVIAPSAVVGPFSVIGPDVTIGEGSRIGSGCHIEHAKIGARVNVANNVTIGGFGFGYETNDETGEVLNFPHIGGVEIHDHVDVGSSTCIDRGSIGDTIVGEYTKIDNLVHVAHNVVLGKRCKVIALAIIGGSCNIGDDVWIAPASAIRDWRNVGEGSVIGLGAVVTKHVPENTTVIGNPAKPFQKTDHRYK